MAAAKSAPTRTSRARSKTVKVIKKATTKKSPPKSVTKKKPLTKKPIKKKPVRKIKPAKKGTLINTSPLSLPQTVSLSILNPFRFPIDTNLLAINTARFAGLAFVLVGGFFALLNLQAFSYSLTVLDALPQTAVVCDSAVGDGCQDSLLDTTKKIVGSQPPIRFILNTDNPLQDLVEVKIEVEKASSVLLYAFHREKLTRVTLGSANKINKTNWKFNWNTKEFEDGSYRLQALVSNEVGQYDQSDEIYHKIQNNNDDSIVEPDEPVEPDKEIELIKSVPSYIKLTINSKEPLSNTAELNVNTDLADNVVIYALKEGASTRKLLGSANKVDKTNWKFSWNTQTVSDGSYRIIPVVKYNQQNFDGEKKYVTVENNNSFVQPSTDTEPTVSTAEETVLDFKPRIKLILKDLTTVSGKQVLQIEVTDQPKFIEIYAEPVSTLVPKFIGLATESRVGTWFISFDSTQLPNNEYNLFARARNQFGSYESSKVKIKILNQVENNTSTTNTIPDSEVSKITTKINELPPIRISSYVEPSAESQTKQPQTAETKPQEQLEAIKQNSGTPIIDSSGVADRQVRQIIDENSEAVNKVLQHFSSALRGGDENAIKISKDRLKTLSEKISNTPSDSEQTSDLKAVVDKRVTDIFDRLTKDTERAESIIRERVGNEINRDTDGDGITDYDEITIYQTDPNSADTDKDGFIDGAEILNGYDPKDPAPEVRVAFESPKDAGLTRSDLLEVKNIVSLTPDPDDVAADGVVETAVITGKGLPNSFVTIYIFSTPVIVTVKTDADGSWSYKFDKELDDGEHEVYVGVTDNAGKIVAKSEPLRFVKEAAAFTPIDAANAAVVTQTPDKTSFATQNVILVVLSISVVGIGVTLILIGLHLTRRREKPLVEESMPTTASL